MKFGYYVRIPLNYPEIRDLAVRIEKLGFESAHLNDHFIGFDPAQDKKEPYLELFSKSYIFGENDFHIRQYFQW